MSFEKAQIGALGEILSAPRKIVIVSHANPDGDSIGSSLALQRVLRAMDHEVVCIVPNGIPRFLHWISGAGNVGIFRDDKSGELAAAVTAAEVIFCVDFNQISRLEGLSEIIAANTGAKKILIDHHLSPPADYDVAFSDPSACSTAFLVYTILCDLGVVGKLDREAAEALYAGIMTDTGNFSFSFLSPELFRAVAALVERGVDPPSVYNSVYNTFSESRMRLMGYVLSRKMVVMRPQKVAYLSLTEEEMRRYYFQVGDSEGFVNLPLSIGKIKMAAMFSATSQFIRISLRSRGDVDVNLFAQKYFEGGGHKNASGGKSHKSMDETIEYFRQAVEEFFK